MCTKRPRGVRYLRQPVSGSICLRIFKSEGFERRIGAITISGSRYSLPPSPALQCCFHQPHVPTEHTSLVFGSNQ